MKKPKLENLRDCPVQSKPCKSCPFEGENPIKLHPRKLARYCQNLIEFKGQHLCHSAENKMICRGGRNLQLKLLYRLKFIASQTDEAFNTAMDEVLGK